MNITVTVALLHKGRILNRRKEIELKEGATLGDLFKALDREKLVERSYFKRLVRSPRPPALLRNGDRLGLPGDLSVTLDDGDAISVVSPFAGG